MDASPASITERPDRDGCDCPQYITIRCVHTLDYNITFTDKDRAEGAHRMCVMMAKSQRFTVAATNATDGRVDCPYCGETNAGYWSFTELSCSTSDSYDDALAAFYAAEERLLRGDDA
jgi:hypothetical protein